MEILQFLEKIIYHKEDLADLHFQGIVEIEKIDYKSCAYPDHEFYIIKGDKSKKKFMKQFETDEEYFDHNLVWQTNDTYVEDSYHGDILFPITNEKYLHCTYYC